jgi:uncharacterized membrane protein
MQKENHVIRHIGKIILAIALFGFFMIGLTIWFYIHHSGKTIDGLVLADMGVSGDYFGGLLNPIFSFFALIALLFTLYVQRNEIKQIFEHKQIEKLEELLGYALEFKQLIDEDLKETFKLGDKLRIPDEIKKHDFDSLLVLNTAPTCQLRIEALTTLHFSELAQESKNLIMSYKNFQNENVVFQKKIQETLKKMVLPAEILDTPNTNVEEDLAKNNLINLQTAFFSNLQHFCNRCQQIACEIKGIDYVVYDLEVEAINHLSPAQQLGILVGDVFTHYRNRPVLNSTNFSNERELESETYPEQELKVLRAGKELVFKVKPQIKLGVQLKEVKKKNKLFSWI